ncbi:histidine phosphatase family protein, partial [Desulfovibrio desulfuricans]|nr:histidine phosphatase family protein [Desulfovibrio desulfuricans]
MFFVRHGQTEWNQLGLVQGRADNSLNETGIEQARTTAEAFRGKTFEAVITSPLIRT